ncbi:3-oxoacyl-[acyl-carrier-protein] reductase [Maritalea myrionectae]|uniref:3beta-hydroxysteroid 3-dehydrogenase n=1 Tax=Maritalea myrionectae TaxID=454601 RepID=A0A2R4MB13_9HYPH|nr:SDR family NAD(P)-dependent oxidoreductase [Maritalea myrionectae]AVX03202.1 3-oxoacyl-[acyl-carrier-protein] reductase [Maritalea myrionectae]
MNEKIAVVTGSYSGIGSALCHLLAADGFELLLLNRDKGKSEKQIAQLGKKFPRLKVRYWQVDLADGAAVRAAAIKIAGQYMKLSHLFLNAGWIGTRFEQNAAGQDMNFAVNVVANYVLVQLLRPSLERGKGVVVASGSGARRMVKQKALDDVLNLSHKKGMAAYAQSKQALTDLFAALSADFAQSDIALKVVDLPPTKTAMAKSTAVPGIMRAFSFFFVAPEKTAQKLYLAALEKGANKSRPPTEAEAELLDKVAAMTAL